MKIVTLLLLIGLAIPLVLLASPPATVDKAPAYPPHEDPAVAPSAFSSISLLVYYTEALGLACIKEWGEVEALLARLKQANIPRDIWYIVDRFNQLLTQLMSTLAQLDRLIAQASELLSQRQLDEVAAKLAQGQDMAGRAGDLLAELELAADTLGRRLGVVAAPQGTPLKEAHREFLIRMSALNDLFEQYQKLLEAITEEVRVGQETLLPTRLTLNVDKKAAFPGDEIIISGLLTSPVGPLSNKEVLILFQGEPLSKVMSQQDGWYQLKLPIPLVYTPTVELTTLYVPKGPDAQQFLASKACQSLSLHFYTTALQLNAPDNAYPGLPLEIDGQVTSEMAMPPRRIQLLVDGISLATDEVHREFQFVVTVPDRIIPGKHTLKVVVAPQGCFAGTSLSRQVNIIQALPTIEMQHPRLALLPGTLTIRGKISSPLGPAGKAEVRLRIGDYIQVITTSPHGEYQGQLTLPWNTWIIGFQRLEAEVKPREPWHATASTGARLFVINLANLGLLITGFASVGVLLRPRVAGKTPQVREGVEVVKVESGEGAAPVEPAAKEDIDRVRGAVYKAIGIIEARRGIALKPSMTLREFLGQVSQRWGEIIPPLKELIGIAERCFYSPVAIPIQEITKAESLASHVEKLTSA